MTRKFFFICFLGCLGMYCHAQQEKMSFDTIPIAEEHHVRDFTLYAVVPKMKVGLHTEQGLGSCRVYIQVDAKIDVDEKGVLRDKQNNISTITILAIKDIMSGRYWYKKGDESDIITTTLVEMLTCYFQNKLNLVSYYLSGQYDIPTEMIYFFVENIRMEQETAGPNEMDK